MTDVSPDYSGILLIGDPHICASPPGHRLDDYAETSLGKLAFCLEAATERGCLPIILGDLFHVPRNNPNHLLVTLIELFRTSKPWVLVGNHDKYEARFTRDVSLSVLHAAGVIRLMDRWGPVGAVTIQGMRVLIGASPDWTPLPMEIDSEGYDRTLWLTHHDLLFPGYESGRYGLKEIAGIDLVVNGHIHTPKPPLQCGRTLWLNPGSITRVTRSPVTRDIRPSLLIWRPGDGGLETIEIPHRPFDEVFPILGEEAGSDAPLDESQFIRGLENLALRKTTEGVGLKAFLQSNLQPDDPIDRIIWELYEEVIVHGTEE